MKERMLITILLVVFCFVIFSSNAQASYVKWSQLPSVDTQPWNLAYSFSSENQVPSAVADDFLCKDGLPIIGVRWWGSYWDTSIPGQPITGYPYPSSDNWGDPAKNPPGTVMGFIISFWSDVPAGTSIPKWSYPGNLLYAETLLLDQIQVKETFYGQIVRPGGIETIFQYDATLPMPFPQEKDKVYWLSIVAIDPNGNPIQWGWHESYQHWNDNAVQMGFPPGGLNPGWWHYLPDKDMAFELKPVPAPTTLLLLGSGLISFILLRRKRF